MRSKKELTQYIHRGLSIDFLLPVRKKGNCFRLRVPPVRKRRRTSRHVLPRRIFVAVIISLVTLLVTGCAGRVGVEMQSGHSSVVRTNSDQIRTGTIQAENGVSLFYRVWAAGTEIPRQVILIIPGIGYHSGPYKIVADYVAGNGYLVIGVDLRGHGRSTGVRGIVPTAAQIVTDMDAVLSWIQEEYRPDRVFVLGESMGGLVALNYAALTRTKIDGLIFVAPALRPARKQVFKLENFRLLLGLLVDRHTPMINLGGARLDDATIDEAFKQDRRADSLAINEVSVNYLLGLRSLIAGWKQKAGGIQTSSIIMHGKSDSILDWRGSQCIYEALSTPRKRLVLFDRAHHTLFWDHTTPAVFAEILLWLKKSQEESVLR